MAIFVSTNAFVSVSGNDISDHIRQVTLDYNAELQDSTAMSNTTRVRLGGLKDWTLELEAYQDFASSELDSILFPLVGTVFAIIVRPDAGVVGATNPNFTGNGILANYSPLAAGVGDVVTTPITINAAGALSRATS